MRLACVGSAIALTTLVALTTLITLTSHIPQAAIAHQTQISDGVGGTHHIEPNDTPKAGELSQTWFALTQAGGKTIGLSDCDCELVLYDDGGAAIALPSLSAIDVEGLTDVPAANLTFPRVGVYVLALSGEPKGAATFSSFRLDFPVTVAAGKAVDRAVGSNQDNDGADGTISAEEGAGASAVPAGGEEGEDRESIAPKRSLLPFLWPLAGVALLVIGTTAMRRKQA